MKSSANFLNTRRLITPLAAIAVAAIVAACTTQAAENKVERANKAVPVGTPVDATVARGGTLTEELEVTGTLLANQRVDIVSELTRKIVKVHTREGSHVKTGTLLFQLDNADLLAQLERLQQQEKLAVLNEKRLKDLIDHDAAVQQDYDQAFTNLKVIEAQIRELQVTIDKTSIRAPFDGQIGIIDVHPGAVVSVNTILTSLEDNSVVKVQFSIPEKYSQVIVPGSEQSFSIASSEKVHKATVVAREASVDADTRSLLVRAVAPNPGHTLLPGQSARISLKLHASEGALTILSQALIPSSLGYSLFVSHNNVVTLVPVEIGQRGAGTVEIRKGLEAGDTVITSNLLRLAPGSPVHIVALK